MTRHPSAHEVFRAVWAVGRRAQSPRRDQGLNIKQNQQHRSTLSRIARVGLLLVAGLSLTACASRPADPASGMTFEEFQKQHSNNTQLTDLNQRLLSMAVDTGTSAAVYRLGSGDEIRMNVFGVDELSGTYRIDGMGRVSLPLIGETEVSGYTLAEAEHVLASRYGERYLRNPQISISVTEFRSQQFTAIGAVAQPRVYATQRRITLVEALAMSGGLSADAGTNVYLTDRIRDPETGGLGTRNLIVGLHDLMQKSDEYNVVLGDSALINVPRAGSIFVEGAVRQPGAYQKRGDTTVLKAITMAGGLKFQANRSRLKVLRRNPESDEWIQETVSMDDIRSSPLADVQLNDGDIVMVESGPIRSAWVGAWEGLRSLVLLGFRPL